MKTLKMKHKVGYGLGDLANGLTFGMSSTFLLAFYTDVLGITAAAAGTLFLAARLWDAVNDPMMGAFADKLFLGRIKKAGKKKVDKFRPFLLRGSFPVVVAAILMFIAPDSLTGVQKIIWAYATYILWGMTYTFVNIPYGSLAAVMTQDPVERSSLSVWRGIGGLFGAVGVRVIVPLFLVAFTDNQAAGYLWAMIILGIVTAISYLTSYFTVEEKIEPARETEEKGGFSASFGVLLKNRPFVAVSIASVAMLIGLMTNGAMNIYYFRENLDALHLMSLSGVIAIIPMLIAAPLIPRMVKKWGTKKTSYLTSLISAAIYAVLMMLPSNPYIYLGISLFAAFFMMIPNMLVWGLVSDCIDYNQFLSGRRREGVIYGAYSFVRKSGQALAGFIAGVGLSIIGYTAGAEQTPVTLFGIKFLTIGLPALGMLIAFIAYRFIWNLTPEKQAEVTAAININTTQENMND